MWSILLESYWQCLPEAESSFSVGEGRNFDRFMSQVSELAFNYTVPGIDKGTFYLGVGYSEFFSSSCDFMYQTLNPLTAKSD